MFKKLFKLPAVLSLHQKAPFAEERRRYLLHCAEQGYAHTTLHVMADDLFWVARKLSIYPDLRVTPDQIKRAAKGWSEREIGATWVNRRHAVSLGNIRNQSIPKSNMIFLSYWHMI